MSKSIVRGAAFGLAAVLCLSAASSRGQSSTRTTASVSDSGEPSLPADPRLWFNSPPLTRESLEGKGVVFLFFEEECPNCAAGWPQAQKLAREYDGKPILFVGVNSGTDPRQLKRYLAKNRVAMPVIGDPTREFESAMGVPKLTLGGEVFALRYISGEGKQGSLQGADLAGAAEAALKGAAWKVDPAEIPSTLRRAWKAVELGDYAAAAGALNKAIDARDDELKAGAEKLMEAVEEALDTAVTDATSALAEGDEWAAFKHLKAIDNRFGDYELDVIDKAEAKAKQLAKSDSVREEITAVKLLDKAMAKRSPRDLQKVVKRYPTTEAGARASELLATLPQ